MSRTTSPTADQLSEPQAPPESSRQAYEQALAYWYSFVNYEQRSPKPSDLKLDRMRALLDRLGNPEQRLRVVHVAGSKGKGSTAAMLGAVLRQAGHPPRLFPSPPPRPRDGPAPRLGP